MNEKIAHQIEKMKKQTIGVEVEMNNIKRDKAARLAADFFGTGRYENTASRNGYMTWSAWDEQGREWKFQKDVSIAGDDAHKCEMVTPILKYEDMETLQELIRKLRKAGTKANALCYLWAGCCMRKCDVGSGLLHGDSGNCMDEGKYDGADFTVGFGWYDAAVLWNAGTDCTDC